MICSILLLITLTSCVSGPFVLNVTQSSYQAEENHNVTLEWTFSTRTDGSPNYIFIFCEMLTVLGPFVLFDLHEGVEISESQDKRFAGRVQFDKDVLREGRVRLHVSRLRTNDSGIYYCRVVTNYGKNSKTCNLNVTAARDQTTPETPNPTSGGRRSFTDRKSIRSKDSGRIVLYCVLGLIGAGIVLGVCYRLYYRYFCRSRAGLIVRFWRGEQDNCTAARIMVDSGNGSLVSISEPFMSQDC